MKELRFDGRSVIVTGAGRGVGRCHALLLAARGARVVVADYGGSLEGTGGASSGPANDVVREIKAAGGEAVACYASVADPAGARSIVDTALDSFGRLDAVINNAGISELELFEDLSLDHFRRMVDVHYLGTVYVLKAAWPHLMKAKYGRVVNTCSEGAFGIHPMVTGYGGAKGGVFGFTRVLAVEGSKYGIRVNAVAPRANTRLGNKDSVVKVFNMPAEQAESAMAMMRPELVAPVAAFLAHESCTLNGEVLVGGGGQVQRLILSATQGLYDANPTPEFIATHLDKLIDPTGAGILEVRA
jgi:NAD(P)-dependent dehydrogenase (short-subunit alcohol dehydrogenase family)